jgi:hypothetical protein
MHWPQAYNFILPPFYFPRLPHFQPFSRQAPTCRNILSTVFLVDYFLGGSAQSGRAVGADTTFQCRLPRRCSWVVYWHLNIFGLRAAADD